MKHMKIMDEWLENAKLEAAQKKTSRSRITPEGTELQGMQVLPRSSIFRQV